MLHRFLTRKKRNKIASPVEQIDRLACQVGSTTRHDLSCARWTPNYSVLRRTCTSRIRPEEWPPRNAESNETVIMLPSTGYFKTINCPFYDSGSCDRPYCHFKHTRRGKSLRWAFTLEVFSSSRSLPLDRMTCLSWFTCDVERGNLTFSWFTNDLKTKFSNDVSYAERLSFVLLFLSFFLFCMRQIVYEKHQWKLAIEYYVNFKDKQ